MLSLRLTAYISNLHSLMFMKSLDVFNSCLNVLMYNYYVLAGIQTVCFKEWEKINKVEMEKGSKSGKPREKIVDIGEMLNILKS